VHTCSDH